MTAASADWVGVTDGEAGGRYCTVLHCTMGDAFTEHGVIGKIFVAKNYLVVTPSVFKLQKQEMVFTSKWGRIQPDIQI